jgi:hypothetical protein
MFIIIWIQLPHCLSPPELHYHTVDYHQNPITTAKLRGRKCHVHQKSNETCRRPKFTVKTVNTLSCGYSYIFCHSLYWSSLMWTCWMVSIFHQLAIWICGRSNVHEPCPSVKQLYHSNAVNQLNASLLNTTFNKSHISLERFPITKRNFT